MTKPKRLRRGDRIAIVSLSWGGLGDEGLIHKYRIAKHRLEGEFGLEAVPMPNALKGSAPLADHPELRALDLMEAFRDRSIAGIFCAIGGEDSIRTLPFVDFDVIRNNPKVFMGYSDNTVNHLMMQVADLVSFYGPSVMNEFGEYGTMHPYTRDAVEAVLFRDTSGYAIASSPEWSDHPIPWKDENMYAERKYRQEMHGYEVLQGSGKASGHLLGGCAEVFIMCFGTSIWPPIDKWRGALLFIETSEDKPEPGILRLILRNLAAQGILGAVNGIIVGKPKDEAFYDEYKDAFRQVVAKEERLPDLPIFYNANFGHSMPIGIIPYGIKAELDCDAKTITLLESCTEP